MSKTYKISFGPENETLDGKNLMDQQLKAERLFEDDVKRRGVNPNEISTDTRIAIRSNIISIRDSEKRILIQLLEVASNNDKCITAFNEIADTISQIENSDDHVILTETDLNRIRKAFEKVDVRPGWLRCRELFKQIQNPVENNG